MCPMNMKNAHIFFNNEDKIERNFIKNFCASHMLLKKNGHASLLQIRLKEIPPTQLGKKLCPNLKTNLQFFYFVNDKIFLQVGMEEFSLTWSIKMTRVLEHVRYTCFFNTKNKIRINFIKNLCTFHMLKKN